MDASDLRIFEAAARTGNITKAATILNTVQSNVTARIRSLEGELRVLLFHRNPRGVTLTIAGQRLLPYARRVLQLIAEAKVAVDESADPCGQLIVGTLETTAAMRLPPVLTAYRRRFPQVDLSLRTATTSDLIEDVLQHRLEGAFVAGPVHHPDLIEDVMFPEDLVLITPRSGPSFDQLVRTGAAEIIVLRVGCSYRQRLEMILGTQGITNIRRLELGTLEGIIGLVSAGIGISLLPRVMVAAALRERRISVQELDPAQSRVDTVFIRRRDSFYSTALSELVELMKRTHRQTMVAAPITTLPRTAAGRARIAVPSR